MRGVALVLLAVTVAGCQRFDAAPAASVPDVCEAQVYADPHVKDLLMKSAGSYNFARDHEDELKFAKQDAAHRCLQLKGLLPPGGGVQRPTVRE
jgi:hypothetical protein